MSIRLSHLLLTALFVLLPYGGVADEELGRGSEPDVVRVHLFSETSFRHCAKAKAVQGERTNFSRYGITKRLGCRDRFWLQPRRREKRCYFRSGD